MTLKATTIRTDTMFSKSFSEEAYHAYIYMWLRKEQMSNDALTSDMIWEIMRLVLNNDYISSPADKLWEGEFMNGSPMTYELYLEQWDK